MDTKNVSVVGVGAMGSAVAQTLLDSGLRVTIWNRTGSATRVLARAGASVADSVEDAVAAGDLVVVTLADHPTARDVLAGAFAGDGPTVVTFMTGSVEDARETHELLGAEGAQHLDVGVQTSPADIGSDRGSLLYAGPRRTFDAHRETLALLGPTQWVGEDVGGAAVWDLALFGVWYDAQLGLLRALDLVRSSGVDPTEFAASAARQVEHVSAAALTTAHEVAARDHPRGPASLAEHLPVLSQLHEQRGGSVLGDGGLGEIEVLARRMVAAGHGGLGLTALVEASGVR